MAVVVEVVVRIQGCTAFVSGLAGSATEPVSRFWLRVHVPFPIDPVAIPHAANAVQGPVVLATQVTGDPPLTLTVIVPTVPMSAPLAVKLETPKIVSLPTPSGKKVTLLA